MKYKVVDGKIYELAAQMNVENDEFYYNSPLWTNDELLNPVSYNDDTVNTKHRAFIKNKLDNLLVEINDKVLEVKLPKEYSSLKDLFLDSSLNLTIIDNPKIIVGDTVSPWGIDRSKLIEQMTIGLVINYQFSQMGYDIFGRIGIILNESRLVSFQDCGSIEGVGIYNKPLSSQSGHSHHTHNQNSGLVGWNDCGGFYKAKLYVPYIPKYLISENGKYFGKTEDGSVVEIDKTNIVEMIDRYSYTELSDKHLLKNIFNSSTTARIVKISNEI